MGNPVLRRMATVSGVAVSAFSASVLLPLLIAVSLLVDAFRYLLWRRRAVATRIVIFGWLYLIGEVWAIVVLGLARLIPGRASLGLVYRLQGVWAAWNFHAFRFVFDVTFDVEGDDVVEPPPILILARHASLVDSLLPVVLVANRHGLRLRYVLKEELLMDPALDIAGNMLPNHFIDRESPDFDAIRDLASGMGPSDGVVIFPEGTRYSEPKRDRIRKRNAERGGTLASIAASYRNVLPPRPAGTLALLESSSADVVMLAHRGLEGFATVTDIWGGGLVGSTISVKMWRIGRELIPGGRTERTEWLYREWQRVDAWLDQDVGDATDET